MIGSLCPPTRASFIPANIKPPLYHNPSPRFTRFAGETFGALIAVLFMQQAIKGLVLEFQRPEDADAMHKLVNGLYVA